ncbi:MAG: hypothetical protein KAY24_15865, partial [Candidatus Eisenbacteria sp.]|nr:hypothetical protein [Candidatus Eisenbacteria bacterium]
FDARWPQYAPELTIEDSVEIAVQVMGKLRGTVIMRRGASQDEVQQAAMTDARVARQIEGKEIIKLIYVPNRLMNFVVRP